MAKEPNTAPKSGEKEIDLLELTKKVWAHRKMLLRYAIIGAVAGLIIGFSIPRTYTTTVKMAPESKASGLGGNASGLASVMGINIGQTAGTDGITEKLYPDIVKSTPFLLEFADIPVTLSKKDEGATITLFEYVTEHQKRSWWSYVFSFPGRVIGWIRSIGTEKEPLDPIDSINIFNLPKEYRGFVKAVDGSMQVVVDKTSSMINISVTMQDPLVSAVIADSLVVKLQKYMTIYKTQKTRQDLQMNIRQYEDSKKKYYETEDLLSEEIDRNRTVTSEALRVRIERLRNERNVAYNVYNQTASQVEVNRIKLVEDMPIATIVEPAIVPDHPSAPNKKVIFIGLACLGALVAAGIIVVKELLRG